MAVCGHKERFLGALLSKQEKNKATLSVGVIKSEFLKWLNSSLRLTSTGNSLAVGVSLPLPSQPTNLEQARLQ